MPQREILIAAPDQLATALVAVLPTSYQCVSVSTAELAEKLQEKYFCHCILDLPAAELRQLAARVPHTLFLALAPENKRRLHRELLAAGAFAVMLTPLDNNEVEEVMARADTFLNLKGGPTASNRAEPQRHFHGIIGDSPAMRRLFDLLVRIAEDDLATVLIRGESGTGKEMVARAIHADSPRAERNFVPVNCAAIPDDLLESELFGYAKGAFTGAAANKTGRIQYADGGTLFLDEIGDMKFPLQAKLLRVLQEKEFEPVGAVKPVPVDVRILAATHCDLEQLVREGKFREDLYYRLSVIPVHIPPLKERREDIPLLIDTFIDNFTSRRHRPSFSFAPKALASLCRCDWRGNVRELENLVQYMSVLRGGQVVGFSDLPEKFQNHDQPQPTKVKPTEAAQPASAPTRAEKNILLSNLDDSFDHESGIDFNHLIGEMENRLIRHALRLAAGNKKEAARLLNLKRTTLLEKMKKKSELFAEI
ncbi:MAG: sigma-54 dependent transcriptional regulator [Desulfobulbaceae bacterium]|jgi:DNA-binding NtrC family response regulator|nr:sigma-54 dependent transcriptional regulator [Desulfobulbaceae bacterium]